jgi:predicted metal-binding membrane protein
MTGTPGTRTVDRQAAALAALLLVTAALAWISVIRSSSDAQMGGMPGMQAAQGLTSFVIGWGVMMTAMMLPSAAPMIVFYSRMSRAQATSAQYMRAELFAVTYLLLWMATGIPVYIAGVLIQHFSATSIGVVWVSRAIPTVLFAAGIYQVTPVKRACLRQCQSPANFLMNHWRSGYFGSIRLASMHAMYCIGCCWALMLILIVAGAMSLAWVLGIAALVAAEKLIPGEWTARVTGVVLIGAAVVVAL